jgi:DNA polymerase-3 subunit delta'
MARILDQVLGHALAKERLLNAIRENRLASTLVFVGGDGTGRRKVALGVAQTLVCERHEIPACGECPACIRIEKQQSESLFLLAPEKNQIKIEQSRELIRFFNLQTLGRARVAIVDEAQTMNVQAANALLKTLEEPPVRSHIILIASSNRHLLPTVRSRAQVIRFGPLTRSEVAQLQGDAEEWALRACRGSLRHLQDLQGEDAREVRQGAATWLESLCRDPHGYLNPEFRELVKARDSALRISRFWSAFFRDALVLKAGGEALTDELLNPDLQPLLQTLAGRSTSWLNDCGRRVLQLEPGLLHNRDGLLLFEDYWIKSHGA